MNNDMKEQHNDRGFLIAAAAIVLSSLLVLVFIGLGGCSVTNLKKCDLVLNKTPPGGRLVCDEREIPIDVVAPWVRKCAENQLKENNK